jgi:MFS family permease
MGRRVVDLRPLRVAAFARLWAAGWVTAVGSQLTAVVVPLEIYGFSGSSAYVGLASLTGLVPMVVAALWGGAIADAVDRRRMLLVTSAGIGATSVLLWVILGVFRKTILQAAAADHMRGRMQGMDLAVAAGGPRLASAAHGLIGAALGTTWAVTGGGLLAAASVIILLAVCPGFARYQADPGP